MASLTVLSRLACVAALFAVFSTSVRAESLLALAGASDTEDQPGNSYAWQIEFQEPLSPHLDASLSWLNEGHTPNHHRDGVAAQLWLRAPTWRERVVLSLAAGPYIYFDTEKASSALGFSDVHSAAGIFTASIAVDLRRSWFLSLNVNDIYAPGDLNTASIVLGVGYHFGKFGGADSPADSDGTGSTTYARQQLQVFGGEMIFNGLSSRQERAAGFEYRLALVPWAAWSATWFYDFDGAGDQRYQAASQLWLVHSLRGGELSLSAGLGLYTALGANANQNASSSVSGLSALRAEWCWSRRSSLILTWYRSFTNDDDDRDIITLGYGLRFGG